MAMRISGIASGLDTDSMVQELVKASSKKKEDLEKAQKKLEWKQETWKDLNAKVYSFFNDQLSNLSLEGSFIKRKTIVSDNNIANVIAGDSAVNGTQTLAVKKLAKQGALTGGKLSKDKSVKSTTTLSDLAGKSGGNLEPTDKITLRLKTGGKETMIELRGSSTISDVIDSLSKAGISANFDEANQRIFLNSNSTGAENDFTLMAGNMNGLNALNSLGLLSESEFNDPDSVINQAYRRWQGATSTWDDTNKVWNYNDKFIEEADKETLSKAEALLKDLDTYKAEVQRLREERSKLTSATDLAKNYNKSEEAQKKVADTATVLRDYYRDVVSSITKQQEIIANKDGTYTADEVTAAQTELDKLVDLYYDAEDVGYGKDETPEKNAANTLRGLRANLSKVSEAYAVASSAASGMGSSLPPFNAVPGQEVAKAPYNLKDKTYEECREFAEIANTVLGSGFQFSEASKSAVRIAGSDATIILNGAEFTSDTNTFNINGLTITATAESAVTARDDRTGEPTAWAQTTITTADDVDGIYDMVKDFFTKYNELIKEMDTFYNADTAKGYEPLTDEEKDALSDTEVEKWEKKIKDSLLRRDGDLGTLINLFKTTMLGSYSYNGKEYSLSSFGINTLSYFKAQENERGVFHINGDADDSNTSAEANDLKAAIASDPKAVTSFFTQLVGDLKEKVQGVMQRTNYRSMYKVYDDKRLQTEYDDYKTKIKAQEKKLQALEDRYYNQFTQMEKALSKLNSQQSYLTSLFGG